MAEKDPSGANVKILLIALGLAVVVVVVHRLHIASVKRRSRPKMISVLCFNNDLEEGKRINLKKHVKTVQIPETVHNRLGNIVAENQLTELEKQGGRLNRDVRKDELVFWYQFTGGGGRGGASDPSVDHIGLIIRVDRDLAPGDTLHVGDRVNLNGYFSINDKPYRAYRVIEGLRVLSVGGKGLEESVANPRFGSSGRGGLRNYKNIGVELPKRDPKKGPDRDLSLQLSNLVDHARGRVLWIERIHPDDAAVRRENKKINPALEELAKRAGEGPSAPRDGDR